MGTCEIIRSGEYMACSDRLARGLWSLLSLPFWTTHAQVNRSVIWADNVHARIQAPLPSGTGQDENPA